MAHERVRLAEGAQREFLMTAITRAGGVETLAGILNICPRTVRDWRREKFTISYQALTRAATAYDIALPKNMAIEDQFWYVVKGARAGGLASYAKQNGQIGDPVIRKQKWREWWEREGRFKNPPTFKSLPFNIPSPSAELAEFMGIMMGDGGMSNSQVAITLHHIDDLAFSRFVVDMIEKLFRVTPSVYHIIKSSVNIIVISRSDLVSYLHGLGLPIGNKVKQNFDIPEWIKRKEGYMVACLRGLVDTDGSIFTHSYRVNGKRYHYKKLSFCSASPPLRASFMQFLKDHGIYTRVNQETDIRIESKNGIRHYMDLIGSHNPKHLKRYEW